MPTTRTEQIAKQENAHVARALRAFLKKNDMTVRQFNEGVLRIAGRNVTAYGWLRGATLPSGSYVTMLAKAMGRPAAFFAPREAPEQEPEAEPEAVAEQANGEAVEPVQPVAAALQPVAPPVIVHAREPRTIARERVRLLAANAIADVQEEAARNSLTYWSNGDGSATVTMVFSGDRERAQEVFRALSGMGVDRAPDENAA